MEESMELAMMVERQPPKKPVRPYSYSDDENESPRVVDDEPRDIERDIPETENEPIEREERQDKPDAPIFEE
jgi:hypothetical protein